MQSPVHASPAGTEQTVTRLHDGATPIVHPQRVLQRMRQEGTAVSRFNDWLADHIVAVAGTMGFFYLLCLVIAGWSLWQSAVEGNEGFDPFPYAFLFFALGGIMQSLFVPTMLTTSNRSAQRDRIKDEVDHRALSHLFDVNEEQVRILRRMAQQLPGDAGN